MEIYRKYTDINTHYNLSYLYAILYDDANHVCHAVKIMNNLSDGFYITCFYNTVSDETKYIKIVHFTLFNTARFDDTEHSVKFFLDYEQMINYFRTN